MKKQILEKDVDAALAKAVRAEGGLCVKLSSIGFDGLPDRLVLMPGGYVYFVELKAPGKQPGPLQVQRHSQIKRLGFQVYVIDNPTVASGVVKTWVKLRRLEDAI